MRFYCVVSSNVTSKSLVRIKCGNSKIASNVLLTEGQRWDRICHVWVEYYSRALDLAKGCDTVFAILTFNLVLENGSQVPGIIYKLVDFVSG